jgi:hypothetical protein
MVKNNDQILYNNLSANSKLFSDEVLSHDSLLVLFFRFGYLESLAETNNLMPPFHSLHFYVFFFKFSFY